MTSEKLAAIAIAAVILSVGMAALDLSWRYVRRLNKRILERARDRRDGVGEGL